MLNHKGEVAECTGDNIFLVRHGRLLTPPLDAGILEGITRDAVIELARQAGIEVRETPLTKHDVYIADECFLTGTAAEVVPVVKVDSRTIGDGTPGPITRDLMARFHKLTQGQVEAMDSRYMIMLAYGERIVRFLANPAFPDSAWELLLFCLTEIPVEWIQYFFDLFLHLDQASETDPGHITAPGRT